MSRYRRGVIASRAAVVSTLTYAQEVAADAPISYWRMGEASGTTAADARGVNPGTYPSGVVLGVTGAVPNNTAVSTTGSGMALTVPDSPSLSLTATFGLEMWYRLPSGLATGTTSIARKNATYGLQIQGVSKYVKALAAIGGSVRTIQSANGSLTSDQWAHIVATYDGSTLALYLNGALVASAAYSGTLTTYATPFTVGGSNGSELTAGAYDEVAIYPTALSAPRVAAHYAARTR